MRGFPLITASRDLAGAGCGDFFQKQPSN